MHAIRALSPLDRLLAGVERALSTVAGSPQAARSSPGLAVPDAAMDERERKHAAGLMRVNHVGEVCAQALYDGQAALARDVATCAHLRHAADEETDHLAWCATRLRELDSRPSRLNALWYAGSYAIGLAAAAIGDRLSLGFVVETERQVEAHLREHQRALPPRDLRSRAILKQMEADEARHAQAAERRGGAPLPLPLPQLMALASKLMKTIAYRV